MLFLERTTHNYSRDARYYGHWKHNQYINFHKKKKTNKQKKSKKRSKNQETKKTKQKQSKNKNKNKTKKKKKLTSDKLVCLTYCTAK